MVMFAANGFVYASFIPRLAEVRDKAGLSTGGLGLVLTVGASLLWPPASSPVRWSPSWAADELW